MSEPGLIEFPPPTSSELHEEDERDRRHTRTLAAKSAEAKLWKRKYRELLAANKAKACASERIASPGAIDLDAVVAAVEAFLHEERIHLASLKHGSPAYIVNSNRNASRESFGRAIRAAVAKPTAKKGRR